MKTRKFKSVMYVMLCIAVVFALGLMAGCSGSDGANGLNGTNGTNGAPGTPGTSANMFGRHSVNQGAVDQTISNVVMKSVSGVPTVSFHVESNGAPVTDLSSGQIAVYLANLVPAGTVSAATGTAYSTDYFNQWASEHGDTVDHSGNPSPMTSGAVFGNKDAANGNYSWKFSSPFGTATAGSGLNIADYNAADVQRLVLRISGNGTTTLNTIAFLDFNVPASGHTATALDSQRQFVTIQACMKCHTKYMDNAAHADSYTDTRACDICHSPFYGSSRHTAGFMDVDDAMLPVFIHQIHAGTYTNARKLVANDTVFPQEINNCAACHNAEGQSLGTGDEINNWNTHPTARVCSSCHTGNTVLPGEASMIHDPAFTSAPTGTVTDSACTGCHDSGAIIGYHSITLPTFVAPPTGTVASLTTPKTPEYNVVVSVSTPSNGTFFQAGEQPVVTITLTNSNDGSAVPAGLTAAAGHEPGYYDPNSLSIANMYAYGPRSSPRPSFLPSGRTDTGASNGQGSATSINLMNSYYKASRTSGVAPTGPFTYVDGANTPTATGWTYTLAPIPANALPGTYLVRVYLGNTYTENISDGTAGTVPDQIVSYGIVQFQVGTATVDERIAGEASNGPASCIKCHGDTMMHSDDHAAPFDPDHCNACHYIGAFGNTASGGVSSYGDPIANRVHAVHSASVTGDLHNRDWSTINYPSNIERCSVCHSSGNTSYLTNLYEIPCYGCHADVVGAAAHMSSMGGSITSMVSVSTSTTNVPESCGVCHSPGKDVDISNAP